MQYDEEVACACYNGSLKFIAVDVEEIGDIMQFKDIVYGQIDNNRELPKKNRQEQMMALRGFVTEFFNSNNEKVRIHPKNEAGRPLNYYDDIIAAFPASAKVFAVYAEVTEDDRKKEEKLAANGVKNGEEEKSTATGVNNTDENVRTVIREDESETVDMRQDKPDELVEQMFRLV